MQRIFWDANVTLDLIEKDAEDHIIAKYLHDMLCKRQIKMLCSPTTVCITWHYFEKFYRKKKAIKPKMDLLFSNFEITSEDGKTVKRAFDSDFYDIEEAVQYFSAVDAKADIIITKNVFDFIKPSIEVLHPSLYIELYL